MIAISLSIDDAVKASGIGRSSLYEAMAAGRLPARKFGRRTVIMADDLKQFVESLPALAPSREAA